MGFNWVERLKGRVNGREYSSAGDKLLGRPPGNLWSVLLGSLHVANFHGLRGATGWGRGWGRNSWPT